MRRHGLISTIVACALIVLIAGMIPLTCAHKLSQGCPFTHKMKAKANPCLRDSVTSSPDLAGMVGLPPSGPMSPDPAVVLTAATFDSETPTANT
jgi:hypothetical protein